MKPKSATNYLANYLPYYPFKAKRESFGHLFPDELVIHSLNYRTGNATYFNESTLKIEGCEMYELKPLLHPISRLTLPIKEGIPPILYLARLLRPEWKWYIDDGKAKAKARPSAVGYFSLHYLNGMFWMVNPIARLIVVDQKLLFKECYKMHIDLDNLIPQELALEIPL